jgi:hypothetical protein
MTTAAARFATIDVTYGNAASPAASLGLAAREFIGALLFAKPAAQVQAPAPKAAKAPVERYDPYYFLKADGDLVHSMFSLRSR